MTSAQDVETSVNVTNLNLHPDDQTKQTQSQLFHVILNTTC